MNDTTINIGTHIPAQVPAFNSLGYICRSEIAKSYGNSYSTNSLDMLYSCFGDLLVSFVTFVACISNALCSFIFSLY